MGSSEVDVDVNVTDEYDTHTPTAQENKTEQRHDAGQKEMSCAHL